MKDHYNTTNESGQVLKDSKKKALTQQERILRYFKTFHFLKHETPDSVCKYVFNNRVPITSVRRAMTNLTDAGLLEKTNTKRPGRYGKDNYCWY